MAPSHISWKLSVILDSGRWADSPGLDRGAQHSSRLPRGSPSSGPRQLLPMSLCQLELTGFYAQREDGRRTWGESGSVISPLSCAVNSVQEGVSGEPDVASGDHLVSVLKGWGASQGAGPMGLGQVRQTEQCLSVQRILNSGSCLFPQKKAIETGRKHLQMTQLRRA